MTLLKKISLVIVSLSLVAVSSVSSAKPFSPKKPVELIIPAGQGGGADEIARLVQGVIEKNDYASKPVIPINKKGGSGGEAMTYVKKKAGDEHTLMITLNNVLTTPTNQPELGIDFFNDFTPLARLITDTFLVWIATEGKNTAGVETFDDLELKELLQQLTPSSKNNTFYLIDLDTLWNWDRKNEMKFIYKILDLMNRNYQLESVSPSLKNKYLIKARHMCEGLS